LNRITRTTIALFATVAASIATVAVPTTAHASNTVYINGVAYEDRGIVSLGDGADSISLDATDVVIDAVNNVLAAAGACAPKKFDASIYEPSAHVYYGSLSTIYVWEDLGEASIEGCPNNTVKVSVQTADTSYDGTSTSKVGSPANGSGKARAGAIAELVQTYDNLTMALGNSYHQLSTVVSATQSDGKTTTAWCSKKTWLYRATLTGPLMLGSSPTETVKCAA